MEELIRVGAYRSGADEEVDAAIRFFGPATEFLSQRKSEHLGSMQAFAEIYRLLEAGFDVPLPEEVDGEGA